MTVLFILLAIPCAVWLPWWALPILAAIFGFVTRTGWRQAAIGAIIVAVLELSLAIYFDGLDHGLVSKRLGGVFSAPAWVIYFAPPIFGAWISFFFARLGGTVGKLLTGEQ